MTDQPSRVHEVAPAPTSRHSQLAQPFLERTIGPVLSPSWALQQLFAVTQIAARLSATARALAFAESARLKLARTQCRTGIVGGEMATPCVKRSSPLLRRAFHCTVR